MSLKMLHIYYSAVIILHTCKVFRELFFVGIRQQKINYYLEHERFILNGNLYELKFSLGA